MIAVTGAGGHLGQWVVARLTGAGHDVLAISRNPLPCPTLDEVRWVRPVRTLPCDLADRDGLESARAVLGQVDVLVHLAAYIPEDTSRNPDSDADETLRTNVGGTLRLLGLLGELGRVRSIVYASTFEVYGPPVRLPLDEEHPTLPIGYYGASKLAAEKYALLFGKTRRVPCGVLRMPAIYGPGDRLRRAIGNFVRAAAAGEDLRIDGDGKDRRDLIYAADAAEAVSLAVERRASGVFNIGGGVGHTIREMAEASVRAAGGVVGILHGPRIKPPIDSVLDIKRARGELGWIPRTSLEEGVRAQLAWARRTPAGR